MVVWVANSVRLWFLASLRKFERRYNFAIAIQRVKVFGNGFNKNN
jgi:hypothetical protein